MLTKQLEWDILDFYVMRKLLILLEQYMELLLVIES